MPIDDQARIHNTVSMEGPALSIARAHIDAYAHIGEQVEIQDGANIGGAAYIGRRATVGAQVMVGRGAYVGEDAVLYPAIGGGAMASDVNYKGVMRNAIVGDGIHLPGGVSVPEDTVIPDNDAFHTIAFMGNSNRVVTVFGSESGFPKYVVGCQKGVSLTRFRARTWVGVGTSRESADRYKPFLGVRGPLAKLGRIAQESFNDNLHVVDELRIRKQDHIADQRKAAEEAGDFHFRM